MSTATDKDNAVLRSASVRAICAGEGTQVSLKSAALAADAAAPVKKNLWNGTVTIVAGYKWGCTPEAFAVAASPARVG